MHIHPKVFISYSHDSEEHKLWVKNFATYLRRGMGVDVILDQWDLTIGSDLALYMEKGLTSSNLVICICSDKYVEKANEGTGGTGYEKMIITAPLLSDSSKNYIIPVKRNNTKNSMPTFLRTKLYVDFDDDDKYLSNLEDVVYKIYGEDLNKKPTIGNNPFAKNNFSNLDINISLERLKYQNTSLTGMAIFNYSNNNGVFSIGNGDWTFKTYWSKCSNHSIYACNDKVKHIGYNSNIQTFPNKIQTSDFDFTSRIRTLNIGDILIWVNASNNFAATKVLSIKDSSRGDSEDLLEFEYKIYF